MTNTDKSPELMITSEVAELLRMSEYAVRDLTKKGRLPKPTKVGKAMLWRRDELRAFVGLPTDVSADDGVSAIA